MKLMNQIINTPFDDVGVVYDPDWRDHIARTWVDAQGLIPDTHHMYGDEYIKTQHAFLLIKRPEAGDIPPYIPDDYRSYVFAFARHSEVMADDMRARLDALLLTDVPYSVIAKDLGGSRITVEDIRTYERLYFNIRDEEGRVDASCFLRGKFATAGLEQAAAGEPLPLPIFWKATACLFGYTGLIRIWGWSGVHGELQTEEYMDDVYRHAAESELMRRILRNEINTFDLNAAIRNNNERAVLRKELAADKGQPISTSRQNEFITAVLQRAGRPAMLPAARTQAEQSVKGEIWNTRINGLVNVAGYKVNDAGAEFGKKAVSQRVDEQFKAARNG